MERYTLGKIKESVINNPPAAAGALIGGVIGLIGMLGGTIPPTNILRLDEIQLTFATLAGTITCLKFVNDLQQRQE